MKKVLIICVLGSLLRVAYGWKFMPWQQSPDQLAWEMILDEVYNAPGFHYNQLIHYPHEGGTILVSILALVIKLFTSFPSLTIAIIVLDFFSRLIQLRIAKKLFSEPVFLFFGTWTVFGLPSLIPWGTVNFGLHALSAVFPFLLLNIIYNDDESSARFRKDGILLALFIWFSYDNLILLPVYLIWLFIHHSRWRTLLQFAGGFAIILLAHFMVRTTFDAGFYLDEYGVFSVRGVDFSSLSHAETYKNLYKVWINALPGASMLPDLGGLTVKMVRNGWLILCFTGFLGLGGYMYRRRSLPVERYGLLIVMVFLLLYAISPFYAASSVESSYVYYRHMAYILPITALLVISGLSYFKWHQVLSGIYLAFGMYGTMYMLRQESAGRRLTKESGYVLGAKLGHQPARVYQIANTYPEYKEEVLMGIGWGMSTSLFSHEGDTVAKKELLISLAAKFPAEAISAVRSGIEYSFSDYVTPHLDKRLLPDIIAQLPQPETKLSDQ